MAVNILHPRIRTEGSKFALKNRKSGNWFHHRDFEDESRMKEDCNQVLNEVYDEDWLNKEEEQEEERKIFSTVGRERINDTNKEVKWYKHDDNANYRPKIKNRLRSQSARLMKSKQLNETENNHDYYSTFSRSGPNRDTVLKNSGKIRGVHEVPQWFKHPDNKKEEEKEGEEEEKEEESEFKFEEDEEIKKLFAPKARVTNEEALEIRNKNLNGYAQEYMQDGDQEGAELSWRPESRDGNHQRSESENLFHNDNNEEVYHVARRCPSRAAQDTYNKSRGLEMMHLLHGESLQDNKVFDVKGIGYHRKAPHDNHFLNSVHKKNTEGIMKMIMDHHANNNFTQPIIQARAVKPEAKNTFTKNRGHVMAECMKGYLDKPHKKELHKTSNMNASFLQKQRGKEMKQALRRELNFDPSSLVPRAVKKEGEKNWEKNKGTMANVFESMGELRWGEGGKQGLPKRLRSAEARSIAKKSHFGSMKSLLF